MQENIKKLLKTDKTGLVNGFCSVPWSDITINENGYVYACRCNGYVKKPICNLHEIETPQEFLNIFNDNIMKASILDGSYRLCNGVVCPIIQDNILSGKTDEIVFVKNKTDLENIFLKNILMQVDESCNLECPTCRDSIIINKNNKKTENLKKLLQKIENLIINTTSQKLYFRIVGNGELFASNVMLPWFLNFDFEKYPHVNFDLHTNATLLSRHENYLLKIANHINHIEVSTDAGSQQVYEKVRKNGKWNDFIAGLNTIQKMRSVNPKITLATSFVTSSLNYKDIVNFFDITKKYNSKPVFYKVLRWNMSEEKFKNLNIFSPKHPEHNEFVNFMKNKNLDLDMSSIFNFKLT